MYFKTKAFFYFFNFCLNTNDENENLMVNNNKDSDTNFSIYHCVLIFLYCLLFSGPIIICVKTIKSYCFRQEVINSTYGNNIHSISEDIINDHNFYSQKYYSVHKIDKDNNPIEEVKKKPTKKTPPTTPSP